MTTTDPVPDVPDPRWLRARRATLSTPQEVESFASELTELGEDLTKRPGSGLATAVTMTVIALIILAVGLLAGWWVLGLAQSMWGSLTS